MDDQCKCDFLKEVVGFSSVTGMVRVSSGLITQDDMDRADEAARVPKVHFIPFKRECFVLSNGEKVPNPKGMQSSRLESIWRYAIINTGALIELLEVCDGI